MKKFLVLAFVIISLGILMYPSESQAAGLVPCGGSGETKCTLCDLIVGFHNLTQFFLKLLVVFALAGITIAGVMYVISAGSEKMITQAKSFLMSSLIGFVVVLGAWLIISVTMQLISAKGDLGIDGKSWNTFECQ